ncbi:MAG: DUF6140 family protein [Porphyromonadaceae bacterium]|nr:DUF6140 family protein [Porphyromonadaceae bacterium]
MAKAFRITPERIKRANGTVLTPEMTITVTTQQHTTNPFYYGANEIKEAYIRLFRFDFQKANCNKNDFDVEQLD